MSSLWQDARLAFRVARRTPATAVGLLVTMGVAVAGCATVFAVVNAVLLRPLPFRDPARLIHIQAQDAKGAPRLLSVPTWEDWRAGVRGVALATFSYADFSVLDGGQPETLSGTLVSPEFFDVTGVAPTYGRAFQRSDFAEGERTVILTHSFWTRRFGGDPTIVGKVVNLSGPEHLENADGAYLVVGVMPRQFWLFSKRLDVIVPFRFSPDQRTDRSDGLIQHLLGRLSNGSAEQAAASIEQAAAEIDAVARRTSAQFGTAERVASATTLDLRTWHFGDIRSRLVLLLVASVAVLLLAAMNVAALLMAQMIGRRHEFDIRMALGASRATLLRQSVIEALVFGVMGGLLGLGLGLWTIALVRSRMPVTLINRIPGEAAAISLDPAVSMVLVAAVVTVSLLSGLASALLLGIAGGKDSLHERTKGTTAAPRKLRLRAGIVALQVALSAALVLTTLVLAQNQQRLVSIDLGVDPRNVVSFWLNPPQLRYPTPASRTQFFDAVIARTRGLPGIERVSGVDVPFHMDRPRLAVMRDGRTSEAGHDLPTALPRAATTEYFATMGIELLKGRLFEATDVQGSPPVALVSRGAADLIWPGEEAIGRTIRPGGANSKEPWSTVVGIVEDVRYRPYAAPLPIIYRPVAQKAPAWLYLIARTSGEPSAAFTTIPQAVWSVDKEQPLDGPFLASTWVANPLAGLRLSVVVAWMFATLALVLSMAGLYGLTAHSIGQSKTEIGIRKALGATDRMVTRLFLTRVAAIVIPALIAGLMLALLSLRLIRAEIDGLTFTALWWLVPTCCVVFGIVCAAAAYVPLRRIRAVDPALSMRAE